MNKKITKLNSFGYPVRIAKHKCADCGDWAFVAQVEIRRYLCNDCKEDYGGLFSVIADEAPEEAS